MNNLVFNTVASELRTLISNASVTVNGSLEVSNTVSVTGSVDVTNTVGITGSVDVSNTVGITGDVTVSNTVGITGDVTVSNTVGITGDVTVSNTVAVAGGVSITGHTTTATNTTVSGVTSTGVIFDNTDISQITTGSFFVYNTGGVAFTVSVQVSPTTASTFYAFDPDNDNLPVGTADKLVIALSKYGNFARLYYDAAATTITFSAYYNGQM